MSMINVELGNPISTIRSVRASLLERIETYVASVEGARRRLDAAEQDLTEARQHLAETEAFLQQHDPNWITARPEEGGQS